MSILSWPCRWLVVLLLASLPAGLQTWRLSSERADHAKAVAAWSAERTTLANDRAAAIEARNTAERAKSAANLEIANDQARLKADADRRVADAQRAAAGLRNTLYAIGRAERPTDPAAARQFDAATTARELLGACAGRYTDVAGEADGLRDQVTGLQRYVSEVCQR